MSDPQNTQGVPGENEEADTASGGAPERLDGTTPDDDEESDDRTGSDGEDAQGH
ncbi:hypothetical protein OED01_08460 [Microbacterium sp. M28]|uniref:hypothetical protein n=1 Tax=Microbacterium sp. M28 TaxID=2962064 RepID=UPI0021F4C925|nr:hypothetical protein [Microbacterium sp. M28]UYO95651.1 hypothetical protein OED01_08460 [Microbacterium sp. M28]